MVSCRCEMCVERKGKKSGERGRSVEEIRRGV